MTDADESAGGEDAPADGEEPHAADEVPADGEEPPAASVAARDEVAGVVDLFGALTRAELRDALSELAFKRGADVDDAAVDAAVDAAIREYVLVPVEVGESGGDDGTAPAVTDDDRLAVGPAAFPTLPDRAEDLPHILDVEERDPDREALGRAVRERLRAEVDALLDAADGADAPAIDAERAEALLDVCYDLDVWAPVETDDLRDRLTAALDADA